jgi:hypothetical protein
LVRQPLGPGHAQIIPPNRARRQVSCLGGMVLIRQKRGALLLRSSPKGLLVAKMVPYTTGNPGRNSGRGSRGPKSLEAHGPPWFSGFTREHCIPGLEQDQQLFNCEFYIRGALFPLIGIKEHILYSSTPSVSNTEALMLESSPQNKNSRSHKTTSSDRLYTELSSSTLITAESRSTG